MSGMTMCQPIGILPALGLGRAGLRIDTRDHSVLMGDPHPAARIPASGPVPAGIVGYQKNAWPNNSYDVARAKKFLVDAGYPDGNIIRGNLIHDIEKSNYGGWAIYPDEGSAHILFSGRAVYDDISHKISIAAQALN